jgi:hypothetical protein
MKNKNLLMTAIAIFGLVTITSAQVPSYVPSNGLVGWWPFNGNANDESGNGFNGVPSGANLTSDRFGNLNQAYSFDGIDDYIEISNYSDTLTGLSISIWFNQTISGHFIDFGNEILGGSNSFTNRFDINDYGNIGQVTFSFDYSYGTTAPQNYVSNGWNHLVATWDGTNMKVIVNNNLLSSNTSSVNEIRIFQSDIKKFGSRYQQLPPNQVNYGGKLDDIGIWDRALTQQEITDLYNGCQLTVNTQPNSQTININNNAQFIAGSSDPNSTFQWQTDLGVGFQNLNNVGQYSGTTNDTLNVVNVTMSNNNQPFRCIINSGTCSDTSNIAVLTLNNNVGINEFTQGNLFSVYPNPAKSQINVKADAKLLGSVYTVYDNTGKLVLTGKIISENTTIELDNLSGGIYMFSVGENMKQTFKVIKE